ITRRYQGLNYHELPPWLDRPRRERCVFPSTDEFEFASVRRTPTFRPRSTENKRDFCGLLSLLVLFVCRSFRVSKPLRKERTSHAEHCPSSLSVFLGFP